MQRREVRAGRARWTCASRARGATRSSRCTTRVPASRPRIRSASSSRSSGRLSRGRERARARAVHRARDRRGARRPVSVDSAPGGGRRSRSACRGGRRQRRETAPAPGRPREREVGSPRAARHAAAGVPIVRGCRRPARSRLTAPSSRSWSPRRRLAMPGSTRSSTTATGSAAPRGRRVTLWSRRGKDWTAQFPEVAAAARATASARGAARRRGRGGAARRADELPGAPERVRRAAGADLVYFVFDLLHLDGEDLPARPLLERKAALARAPGRAPTGAIRYAPHFAGERRRRPPRGVPARARGDRLEAGRRARTGRPERDWVKTKCLLRQELVIGGFTDPGGAARDGLGALLVGYREGRRSLRFAGKVGTGFTNASARALRSAARRAPRRRAALSRRRPRAGSAGTRTGSGRSSCARSRSRSGRDDGKIRHPSFQGLREDKRRARRWCASGPRP